MKEITNAHLYSTYIAVDRAMKMLRSVGVEIEYYAANGLTEEYWRGVEQRELDEGNVPNLYRYSMLQIYPKIHADYSIQDTDAREREVQARREDVVRQLVAQYPQVVVARYDNGQTYVWWDETGGGFGVTVNIGQALCERVLVGEDVEEVPDLELAALALADVPKVQKITPRYEWRCNDAELEML